MGTGTGARQRCTVCRMFCPMDRRSFVAALGGTPFALDAGATALVREANRAVAGRSARAVAEDESYWLRVRAAFSLDANHVHLN